ncbi:MC family mitochondrial carrier protein [Myriangium duriaei CBS 260.36]|uniref:MC family mitochondrial carrier protein n=1 Tax=Myriangium duriaei CBS 260.36 TaxID=1168546 RepID=A0A9P4J9L0_9PEZI|nr:MC family mitochondrial carrier protein [Myriangium duriaei CBS 260.36]
MQRTSDSSSDTHDHGPPSQTLTTTAPTSNSVSSLAKFSTKFPSSSVNSFCGAMAGMASGIVTCPLDVIKTKLQAQGAFRQQASLKNAPTTSALYNGMIGTARTIVRQDGFSGLYRGLGPMLLGYLPTWAVYMAVYDGSREFYYGKVENKWLARIYASITAGACSTLATNPIWVIKTRLMSQVSRSASDGARTPWHYHNTWDAARKMWANEGVASFYSGLTPALLGLTHVAIQFPLYEYFKMKFTGLEMGEASSATTASTQTTQTMGILAATFLSKVCATSATYPHEVLRTRLQTQQRMHPGHSPDGLTPSGRDPSSRSAPGSSSSDGMRNRPRYAGILRTCKVILAEEGWRAFYNGMGTNMFRAVPAAMTTMLTFETLKSTITKLQDEGRQLDEA